MEPKTNAGAKGTEPGVLAQRAADTGAIGAAERKRERQDERERVTELLALGRRFNCPELAEEAVREGVSLQEFNHQLRGFLGKPDDGPQFNRGSARGFYDDWGGHKDRSEVMGFSLTRALHAQASGDWSNAGLELEVSRTLAQETKRTPRGMLVPPHALVSRGVLTSGSASGVAAITENYAASLFDEALRAQSVIFQAGARRLEGLSGDVRIPRLGTGLTGTWIAEEDPAVESDLGLESADLKPHTLSWMMRASRRTLTQSALAMEDVVRRDILAGIAESVDAAALVGSADDLVEPRGIINTAGVGTVTVATENKPTWAEVVEFTTTVEASNVEGRQLAYVMRPEVRGYLMATPKVSGDATMMMDGPDRLAGYRAFATTGMPAENAGGGSILFGDIDIMLDPYSHADRGTLRIVAFSDWGIAVRRAEAFAVVEVA
jgi:HK97 family phage major capsid protein